MSASAFIPTDQLTDDLTLLCAQPASAGQPHNLDATADLVAGMLRSVGMRVKMARAAGPPVVLAWRAGRSPFTILLYHHYDVAPPGPWRAWSHEPFQVAERDHAVYGRGVAHGKGPFIAHLQAVRALLAAGAELPCGLVFVVEGEGLSGSASLLPAVAGHTAELRADACLASGGGRDAHGRPFVYRGSKGLLQVRISANGPAAPLSSGLAASVRNPAWRLTWALANIKGDDEEVRITGFYDSVEGPSRSENAALRKVQLDEAGRLASWGMPEFLFGVTGGALVQAEVTLPTCNLTALASEPLNELPNIPSRAAALLDFQLVPRQQPQAIFDLLREHLIARGFGDIVIDRLPGWYDPAHTRADHPFIHSLLAASGALYGAPLTLLPLGPFTQPLHVFAEQLQVPVASVGFARHTSAIQGPDEHLPLEDLVHHGQLLIELLDQYREY